MFPSPSVLEALPNVEESSVTDTADKPKGCFSLVYIGRVLSHTKDRTIARIDDFFALWAAVVFDYPYWSIGTALLITLVCCIGFLPGIPKWVDGAEALYSLPYSLARSQGALHRALFNETRTRPTFVIVTAQNPGENVMTWEHLNALRHLDDLIQGKTVDPRTRKRVGIPWRPSYGERMGRSAGTIQKDDKTKKDNTLSSSNKPTSTAFVNRDASPSTEAQRWIQWMTEETSPESGGLVVGGFDKRTSVGSSPAASTEIAKDSDILTFEDICSRNSFGGCAVSSVLEMGVFDLREILSDGADNKESPPKLLLFDGLVFNKKKRAFAPRYLIGDPTVEPCSVRLPTSVLRLQMNETVLSKLPHEKGMTRITLDCITKAKGRSNTATRKDQHRGLQNRALLVLFTTRYLSAFQLVYELADRDGFRARNEDWERVFVGVLEQNVNFGPLRVTMNAFRSRDDALRSSTSESSDVLFVGLTFAFIVAYSSGLNFSCDLYRSKAYPALSGVVAAILGMIAGMGFISLCGISFVPTSLVCPFLVVGVGTDDMFVIINGYSLTYMVDSARDRCILSLRDTGLAISITTLTSLVSFAIGLNTGYLSIRNFCYFCGAGLFFGYIFVLLFFFAFHCLDAKREENRRAGLFCAGVATSTKTATNNKALTGDGAGERDNLEQVNNSFSSLLRAPARAEISTFTLGRLMVRRAEQTALQRYARRFVPLRRKMDQLSGRDIESLGNPMLRCSYSTNSHKIEANTDYGEFSVESTGADDDDNSATARYLDLDGQHAIKYSCHPDKKEQGTKHCNRLISCIEGCLSYTSDTLLSRIALEGHYTGMERSIELTPSNGVLLWADDVCESLSEAFSQNTSEATSSLAGSLKPISCWKKLVKPLKCVRRHDDMLLKNDKLLEFVLSQPCIPLYYRSEVTGEQKVFLEEPRGSVGRRWRCFLIKFYGPFLMHPIVKGIVITVFIIFIAVSLYGCFRLESGLELKDLAPRGSYLSNFDFAQAEYFYDYDYPVDIFFPEPVPWWTLEAQQAMRHMELKMRESGSGKLVTNPLVRMLDDEDLKGALQSGQQESFEKTLRDALAENNGKYKQFEQNFVWEGTRLRAWKMQILPAGMARSSERAAWMTRIREDCDAMRNSSQIPLTVMAWNYMMTFYESDLQINSSVQSNMIVAALTMLIIAMVGIPQLVAGFLVIVVMAMIDIGIIGFMYFWDVKLNMVSMICLLISVGFSVDFSAHVCHTFMETQGETRNQRAIETLVLMGNPVFHGAASSILGVLMLGFSESYIFQVFFKMMTLVMLFALFHSVVFLPVLLSLVGDAHPHGGERAPLALLKPPPSFGEEPTREKSVTKVPNQSSPVVSDVSTRCSAKKLYEAHPFEKSDHDSQHHNSHSDSRQSSTAEAGSQLNTQYASSSRTSQTLHTPSTSHSTGHSKERHQRRRHPRDEPCSPRRNEHHEASDASLNQKQVVPNMGVSPAKRLSGKDDMQFAEVNQANNHRDGNIRRHRYQDRKIADANHRGRPSYNRYRPKSLGGHNSSGYTCKVPPEQKVSKTHDSPLRRKWDSVTQNDVEKRGEAGFCPPSLGKIKVDGALRVSIAPNRNYLQDSVLNQAVTEHDATVFYARPDTCDAGRFVTSKRSEGSRVQIVKRPSTSVERSNSHKLHRLQSVDPPDMLDHCKEAKQRARSFWKITEARWRLRDTSPSALSPQKSFPSSPLEELFWEPGTTNDLFSNPHQLSSASSSFSSFSKKEFLESQSRSMPKRGRPCEVREKCVPAGSGQKDWTSGTVLPPTNAMFLQSSQQPYRDTRERRSQRPKGISRNNCSYGIPVYCHHDFQHPPHHPPHRSKLHLNSVVSPLNDDSQQVFRFKTSDAAAEAAAAVAVGAVICDERSYDNDCSKLPAALRSGERGHTHLSFKRPITAHEHALRLHPPVRQHGSELSSSSMDILPPCSRHPSGKAHGSQRSVARVFPS